MITNLLLRLKLRSRASALCLLQLAFLLPTFGQAVRVQEFVPGNYLAGSVHRVVLLNTTGRVQNIGGWVLVTRDYSVRLPAGTTIAANGLFRIGNLRRLDNRLNIELSSSPDFLIRVYSPRVLGNYVLLLDARGQPVDGLYNAELPDVPFLPDDDTLIAANGDRIAFSLPPESAPVWAHFPFAGDPAVGFERAGSAWRVIPANPTANSLYPKFAVVDFFGRYTDDAIELRWTVLQLENVRRLIVERSEDQRTYRPIDTLREALPQNAAIEQQLLDTDIRPGQTYYYRLRNDGLPAQLVYSQVVEVQAQAVVLEFWVAVFPKQAQRAQEVGIRYESAFSRNVTLKLLDADFREVGILYSGPVYAEVQNLLRLNATLPPGRYLVVATTDTRRYFQAFVLGE
jgi:hypothetical protein